MQTRSQTSNAGCALQRAIADELKEKQRLLPLTETDLMRLLAAAPRDDESLWRRQFHTVREISPGRDFARLQQVLICEFEALRDKTKQDAEDDEKRPEKRPVINTIMGGAARVVVKRGKSDWLARAVREAHVHRYLTDLQVDSDDPRYVAPLLAHYDCSPSSSYIVTRLVALGPLADAIQSRRVHITSHRLLHWLDKSDEVLRWMHNTAQVVHMDAKSDNWLLKTKDDIILFDFDECWRAEDFYESKFFEILKRMDYAKFLFTLDDDLEQCGCAHLRRDLRKRSRTLFGEPDPDRAYTVLFNELRGMVDTWMQETILRLQFQIDENVAQKRDIDEADADFLVLLEQEYMLVHGNFEDEQSDKSSTNDNESSDKREVIRLLMRGNRIALV
jgi:serine/threonine protein kinase